MKKGLLCIVILCVLLSSCTRTDDSIISSLILEHNVPFVDSSSRWNDITLEETDEYGRRLYSVKATGDSFNNVFSDYIEDDSTNSPVFAFLICQKYEDSTVYCYKDINYIFVSSMPCDEDVLNNFKSENGWNKELDETKMIALSVEILDASEAAAELEDGAVKALEKAIDKDFQGYYIDSLYSDSNNACYILRDVEVWIDDNDGETNDFGKTYIFIYDEKNDTVIYQKLSDSIETWRTEISNFLET